MYFKLLLMVVAWKNNYLICSELVSVKDFISLCYRCNRNGQNKKDIYWFASYYPTYSGIIWKGYFKQRKVQVRIAGAAYLFQPVFWYPQFQTPVSGTTL